MTTTAKATHSNYTKMNGFSVDLAATATMAKINKNKIFHFCLLMEFGFIVTFGLISCGLKVR